MTQNTHTTPEMDLELDELFAQAREEAPTPSAEFLARVASDAAQTQAGFRQAVAPEPVARVSWWRQLLDDIGGLPAVGGLAACACTGVYLGFVSPDFTASWAVASAEDSFEGDDLMSHAMLGDTYWIEEG